MKAIIGLILILSGIALGLYVGVWLCLILGLYNFFDHIIQFTNGVIELDAWTLVINIVRVLCAGIAGVFSAFVLIMPGMVMIELE